MLSLISEFKVNNLFQALLNSIFLKDFLLVSVSAGLVQFTKYLEIVLEWRI